MRFLPDSRLKLNQPLLVAAVCLVLALGCTQTMPIEVVLDARSCTDDALTMGFTMHTTSLVINYQFLGGTPNVNGIPIVYGNNIQKDAFFLVDLNHAMQGDKVEVKYASHVELAPTLTIQLADVAFYKAMWNTYPTVPDCAVAQTPKFTVTQPVPPGSPARTSSDNLTLEVADPGPLPMLLTDLDLAEVPAVLPPEALDWDSPVFNALSWQAGAPFGATLDPSGAPMVLNLPGTTSAGAVLCRFISDYDGMEVRGIVQVDLSGAALKSSPSTWGAVKALYRN